MAAATLVVALVDPNERGHYPLCPILALTGFYCPGCGGLRAVHALAHGDLAAALGLNLVVVALVPVVLLVWGRAVLQAVRRRPFGWSPPVSWWVAGGLLVACFTLLRNLPVGAAFAP